MGSLDILILLPLPPKCRNYSHAPPYPVYVGLGIEPRVSGMLGTLLTKPHPQHSKQLTSDRHL